MSQNWCAVGLCSFLKFLEMNLFPCFFQLLETTSIPQIMTPFVYTESQKCCPSLIFLSLLSHLFLWIQFLCIPFPLVVILIIILDPHTYSQIIFHLLIGDLNYISNFNSPLSCILTYHTSWWLKHECFCGALFSLLKAISQMLKKTKMEPQIWGSNTQPLVMVRRLYKNKMEFL